MTLTGFLFIVLAAIVGTIVGRLFSDIFDNK